jgi:hypothetical protein
MLGGSNPSDPEKYPAFKKYEQRQGDFEGAVSLTRNFEKSSGSARWRFILPFRILDGRLPLQRQQNRGLQVFRMQHYCQHVLFMLCQSYSQFFELLLFISPGHNIKVLKAPVSVEREETPTPPLVTSNQ